jgi:RNA polymerase sigma-70 factor, ECF subfamily
MPTSPDTAQDRAWHAATVARVLSGDVEAYAGLVGRHRDRLLRYAVRMLSDADEAEDVTQETFVRAYRSLATCEDPSRFGGWIFTILANRCRTAGARRTKRDAVFIATEAGAEDWGGPGAVDEPAVDESASGERIERALMSLNVAHREAFLLKYVEELSYDEIAVLTGAGVSALKMRVSRARDILRAALTEVFDD